MIRENLEPPVLQVQKVWLGDYLFRPGHEDVLEDFQELGDILGFKVVPLSARPDVVNLVNFHLSDVFKLLIVRLTSKSKTQKGIHLVTEPVVIVPALGLRLWKNTGLKIVTLGNFTSDTERYAKPHKPAVRTSYSIRKNQAVMINRNKFSWVRGELYSLRREVASSAPSLDVFGTGWETNLWTLLRTNILEMLRALITPRKLHFGAKFALKPPLNTCGPSIDKLDTLSQYEVCLVIENSEELVTEKIVDSWLAGCFPVYVGPSLENLGFPEGTYLQVEPDASLVLRAIEKALKMDHSESRVRIDRWVSSKDFQAIWDYQAGWSRIFEHISTLDAQRP